MQLIGIIIQLYEQSGNTSEEMNVFRYTESKQSGDRGEEGRGEWRRMRRRRRGEEL
jgi:hypothetical protein